jgi:RNA polymerase sigma factor (sigma-70 family)
MMTDRQPVVFVIDDDQAVREGIESLLASVGLRVETFRTAHEFLASERLDVPSCIVLDVRLPGPSGLDLQRELSRLEIRLPIIFITGHGDVPMSVQAMKAGAVEFLTKPFREQALFDAIHDALERDRQQRAQHAEVEELRQRYSSLTRREREVLMLVVEGMLNKQIAAKLGASEVTIKIHRAQAMQKMRAGSLAELVRIVDRLVSPTVRY